MKKWTRFAIFGLAMAMTLVATPRANAAEIVVGVRIGRVVPRPAYVVVAPRPYYPYACRPYPGRLWLFPRMFVPLPGITIADAYIRGRCIHPHYGPRHFRR